MSESTIWEILGVDPDAGVEEIDEARGEYCEERWCHNCDFEVAYENGVGTCGLRLAIYQAIRDHERSKAQPVPANPGIEEMVAIFLREHGYDGLYNDSCRCSLTNLIPCGFFPYHCRAGHIIPCPPDDCACGGECDPHIGPKGGE